MAHRVQPQTTQGQGGNDYGYNPPSTGGGAHRVIKTGGFGPDADAIDKKGESSFSSIYDRIKAEDERQKERKEPEVMESNPVDEFMSDLFDIGEGLASPKFVRDLQESDNPLGQAAGFVAGLVPSTFGAVPQGLAQGYEAAWGRDVTSDDRKEGETRELNANERLASGVNAVINVGGPMVGGSGRMVKGGYRALKTTLGDAASEGVKKAATKAAKDTAKGFIKNGGWKDLVGDMAEEGGEEFIQSFADDARYGTGDEDSLARAAQSAALGALGGGIMSAAGFGLNKFASRKAPETSKDSDPGSSPASEPTRTQDVFDLGYAQNEGSRYLTPSAQAVMEKRATGSSTTNPGSTSITLMQTDDRTLGLNDAKMGTLDIRNIWNANDNGASKKALASSLGMTVDDAQKMFNADNWEDLLISAVKAKNADPDTDNVKMYWSRNPATKGQQPISSNLIDVFKGSGLMLNPMAYPYVGADVDGDKTVVTYNTRGTDGSQYITSLLTDPQTGSGNFDSEAWMRTGLSLAIPKSSIKKAMDAALHARGITYTNRQGQQVQGHLEDVINTKDYADRVSKALESQDFTDINAVFNELGNDILKFGGDRDAMLNSTFINMVNDPDASLLNTVSKLITEASEGFDYQLELDNAAKPERGSGLMMQGSTPKDWSLAQAAVNMNMLTYVLSNTGNSFFRQYGVMAYKGKSQPASLGELHTRQDLQKAFGQFINTDKFTRLIVSCLKETTMGSHVENSIDTILRNEVFVRVDTDMNFERNKIRTTDDVNRLFESYVRHSNEVAKIAEQVNQKLGALGFSTDTNVLSWGYKKYTDGMYKDTKAMADFLRIFGSTELDMLFDMNNASERYQGMTLDELCELVNDKAVWSPADFISLGRDVNEFIKSMRDSQNANAHIVASKLETEVGNATGQLANAAKNSREGKINVEDLPQIIYVLDAFDWLIGDEIAFDLGLSDPEHFLLSRYGEEIASGDKDRAINAVVSASLSGQFARTVRMFREAETEEQKAYAATQLNKLAKVSALHNEIVAQIVNSENGTSELLDFMTDLDQSWEAKKAEFKEQYSSLDGDLLIMALQNKSSRFDLADINVRRTNSKRSYDMGVKCSMDQARNEYKTLMSVVQNESISDVLFVDTMEELAQGCITEMDNTALAAMIYDAKFFSNESLEKATLEDGAQLYGQGVTVLTDGAIRPLMDKAVNDPLGRMPMEVFANNRVAFLGVLSGQIDQIEVYDRFGNTGIVTRDSIFADANPGNWTPGSQPNKTQWANVLSKNPQLMRILAPQKIQSISIGNTLATSTGAIETVTSYLRDKNARNTARGTDKQLEYTLIGARRVARNAMRRIPGLPGRIVQSIPGISSDNDPRSILRKVNKVMDQMVDTAVARAFNNQDGKMIKDADADNAARLLQTLFSDINDAVTRVQVFSNLRRAVQGAKKNVDAIINMELSNNIYKNDIVQILADSGVDVNRSELFSKAKNSGGNDISFDALKQEADRNVDLLTTIYRVMVNFTDTKDIDKVFVVDPDLVHAVNEAIDGIDGLANADKQRLKHASESIGSLIQERLKSSAGLDSYIFSDADFMEGADIAAAQKKARELWEATESFDKYDTAFDDDIEAAINGFDKNGEIIEDLAEFRRDLKLRLDSKIIEAVAREFQDTTDHNINGNALRAAYEASKVDAKIDAIVRDALANWEPWGSSETTSPRPQIPNLGYPVPHFLDPATQFIVSKLNSSDVPASMVATQTAYNGSEYRRDAGVSGLPRDKVCGMPPRPMTAQAIVQLEQSDADFDLENVKVCKPINGNAFPDTWAYSANDRGKTWKLTKLTQEEINAIRNGSAKDSQFWVFMHDDCENGMCVAHQNDSVESRDGYLALPYIISKINQHSQEAMNLKMKKKPGMLEILGEGFHVTISLKETQFSGNPMSNLSDMLKTFQQARRDVKGLFSVLFAQDNMKDLEYGDAEASQLSQAMVQGCRVMFRAPDGTTFERAVSLKTMSNEAAFQAWLEAQQAVPVSYKPLIQTIEEVSNRGMNRVLDKYHDGMTTEEIEEALYEGATDVEGLRFNTLSIKEIMANIMPTGLAYNSNVPVSTNASRVTRLIDTIEDREIGDISQSDKYAGLIVANESEKHSIDMVNRILSFGNKQRASGNRRVYKTFGAREYGDRIHGIDANVSVRAVARDIDMLDDVRDKVKEVHGMAMAFDLDSALLANEWAKEHKQPFCVPIAIMNTWGDNPFPYNGSMNTVTTGSGAPISVIVFDPSTYEDWTGVSMEGMTSKRTMMTDIATAMHSIPGVPMADAGSLVNADTYGHLVNDHPVVNTLSADDITGGNARGRKNLASHADLAPLVKAIEAGDLSDIDLNVLHEGMNMSDERIHGMLARFADWYRNADNGEFHPDNSYPGEIIGFLVANAESGDPKYYPIILDQTEKKATARGVYLDKDGDSITVIYSVKDDMGDNLGGTGKPRLFAHKIALNGISYKSMGTVIEPGKFKKLAGSDMPQIAATLNGEKKAIDVVVDSIALDGRMTDMELKAMLDNLWYFSHGFLAYNPFIKKVEGGYEFSDALKAKIQEDPTKYSEKVLIDLLAGSGNLSTWNDQIASGLMEFTDDPELNRMIKNLAFRCNEHHIYALDLFRTAELSARDIATLYANAKGEGDALNKTLVNNAVDIDYSMVLGSYSQKKLLKLFAWTTPGLAATKVGDLNRNTVFDDCGRMFVDFGKDPKSGKEIVAAVGVTVGPLHYLNKSNLEGSPSTEAKRSAQARLTQAYDRGMDTSDPDFFMRWFSMKMNRDEVQKQMRGKQLFPKKEKMIIPDGFEGYTDMLEEIRLASFDSASQRNYERKLRRAGDVYGRFVPLKSANDNKVYDNAQSLKSLPEIARAMSDLNEALRGNRDGKTKNFTIDELMIWYISASGSTYNEGIGSNTGSVEGFRNFLWEMTRNVKEGKLPIVTRQTTNNSSGGRYAIPLVPIEAAREMYEFSPALRKTYNTFEDMKASMMRENSSALERINEIKDEGKRNELYRLNDWLMMEWGEKPSTDHIYSRTYLRDMMNSRNRFILTSMKGMFTKEQMAAERKLAEAEGNRYAKLARSYETRVVKRANVDVAHNGEVVVYTKYNDNGVAKALRNASELSRFMAMLEPMIPVANILDRVVHQGITNAAMQYCLNSGMGPYKSSFVPNQDLARIGAINPDADAVFDMIRYASYDGDEGRVLSQVNNMNDVRSYLATRKDATTKTVWRKASSTVFELAGGGKFMQRYQIQNWFNQFCRIISSEDFKAQLDGQTSMFLTKVPDSELTLIEAQWSQDPSHVLMNVFGNTDNPYHTAALQALNFSRAGEACQNNILYAMYSNLAKRSPAVEFFTTTCVSRFFLYSTNAAGRIMNLFMPISSMNYALNQAVMNTKFGEALNVRSMQMYTSMKEAIAVDLMHMAPGIVAFLLAQIPGLLEPPDDEKKRGNPDEWLFCGMRIGEDWLLSDIMGVAGPLAMFFKSAAMGEPRFDLVWNGFTQACYNNPMLKASSAIGMLFDPEETFITTIGEDYADDQETYKDAPGGSPDFVSWFWGKTFANGVSYLSQFMTPTIVRNLANSYEFQRYERAYRYTVAKDARGVPVIDPDTGMPTYQETDYLDAQLRRVTRTNPVMGLLADIFTGAWINGNTGYTAWEQPRTVYYDDAQLESMRLFSINDEDGDPLPADQQQEKVYMILHMLMSYDDMDELAATGFYLDYDTKKFVGDTIHDIIQTMRNNYSEMNASGYFDYYYGGLSYEDGRARAEQLKSEYYAELNFWQSLYYDKLWSEPLKKPLTQYNRYNTTYAQDDEGNWYATGIYNSINPLFHNAPGSIDNPAGTAGYENDWRAVSAVTGQPMDQRALIPVEAGYLDTPDLDSLGDDSNGGYSESFPGFNYSKTAGNNGWSYGNGGRSYGYSRRSGGGGGGGYSPNIYSRVPNVYPSGARTMYAERIYGPNYDYLRPNFETKGSREAYKRSDI